MRVLLKNQLKTGVGKPWVSVQVTWNWLLITVCTIVLRGGVSVNLGNSRKEKREGKRERERERERERVIYITKSRY